MDHLHRHLAPMSSAGWDAIETEARSRLTTHLAARKLVDFEGPRGWAHSSVNLGRSRPIDGPSPGVSAAQRQVLPLVELTVAFSVARRDLDDLERGATDLSFGDLDEAARALALGENVAVFHGYPAAGIRGIAESASSHGGVTLPTDIEHYPNAVARATDMIRRTGIDGPYGLAIAPAIYTAILETTEHGGFLLLDHLRQILGGPVVWAPGVEGGVVLSLRGGDFRLECGQDISVGYLGHDAETVRLYFEESFAFRVLEPDAAVALHVAG
ncbi:MAG TPA: family 1 encapsulin nanocompartment shell protein [Acidimicrobiales bacterium]|nr:family 1 encapsulin nanocompartment shell protein [Acidimicrobiales bacterium]